MVHKYTIFTIAAFIACVLAAGCAGLSGKPKTADPASMNTKGLQHQLAGLSTQIVSKIAAIDPGASIAAFDFSISGLESARGDFFATQLALALDATRSGKQANVRVISRAQLLDRLKKGNLATYDLIESDKFINAMKVIDTDYAVVGNMTEKQFTYLVDARLMNWKGDEVLKHRVEVFKDDIIAEKVNMFGRAMDKLARRLIEGYKGFDSHRIAVYEFKENGIRNQLGEQIAKELPNYLAQNAGKSMLATQIEILTRSQLDQIVREQRMSMGDLFEQDNQAFGKLLQATAIVSGDIAQREGGIYITAQMVDMKTGTLISQGEVRYIEEMVGKAAPRDLIGDTALDTGRDSESGLPLEIISRIDKAVMVLVPGGLSTGYQIEGKKKTKIEKALPAYYIDKYEVTNAQYADFLNNSGRLANAAGKRFIDLHAQGSKIYSRGSSFAVRVGFEKHPVVNVTFFGAKAYAQWAGKRLPDMIEWQKAAGWDPVKRRFRTYPWGSRFKADLCNHGTRKGGEDDSDGFGATAPVSAFPEGISFYKAFNMSGNVWEWCGTIEKQIEYINNLGTRVQKMNERAFVLGGSFRKGGDTLTTTSHLLLDPEIVNHSIGFRCVKDPE